MSEQLALVPYVATIEQEYIEPGKSLAPIHAPDYKLAINQHGATRVAVRFVEGFHIRSYQFDGYTHLGDGHWNNFSIPLNETPKLLTVLRRDHPDVQYTIDDSVLVYAERELKRDRESLSVMSAKDAPDVDWIVNVRARPTQRACMAALDFGDYSKIVALDTGAGKTAIVINYAETHNFRTLIITKASLILNIQAEIKKLTDKYAVILGKREPGQAEISALMDKSVQYFILPYEVIGTNVAEDDEKALRPWPTAINMISAVGLLDLVLADEAHLFGNMKAKRTRSMLDLTVPNRIPLTATPIVNSGAELFPLLKFIAPNTFHSEKAFLDTYFWNNGKTVKSPEKLQRALVPYMFRRSMKDMYDELPEVIRLTHHFDITGEHAKRIKALEQDIFLSLDGYTEKDVTSILPKLNYYRQVVSDATEEETVSIVQDMLADNTTEKPRKVLVFFAFVAPAIRAAKALGCSAIHGEIGQGERMQIVNDFQENDSTRVLVATIKTLQEGHTLTEGTDMVFNDLMWTAKDHKQGEGRCFGRLNNMHGGRVTYMEANAAIVKLMQAIIQAKMELFDTAVEGTKEYASANANIVHELINHLLTYEKHEVITYETVRTSK